MSGKKLKKTTALFLALMMILSMVPGTTIVAHAEAVTEGKVLNAREECDWWGDAICRDHEYWCDYNGLPDNQKPTQSNSAVISRSPDYISGAEGGSNLGAYDGFRYDGIDTAGGYPFYSGVGYPTKVNLDVIVDFYKLDVDATGSGQTIFEWELEDADDWNYTAASDKLATLPPTYKDVVAIAHGYNIYAVTLMEMEDGERVPPAVVAAICDECDKPTKGSHHHAGVILFCIEPAIQFSAIKNGVRVVEYTPLTSGGSESSKNAFHFTTAEIIEPFNHDLFAVVEMEADIEVTLGNVPPIIEGFDDIEVFVSSDAADKAKSEPDGIVVKSGITEILFNGYGGNYDGGVVFHDGGIDITKPGTYIQRLTATDNTDKTFTVAFRTVTIAETIPEVLLASDFSFGKTEGELGADIAKLYANVSATDKFGDQILRDDIIVNANHLKAINEGLATAKSGDKFFLEFKTPSGDTVKTVEVEIKDYGNADSEGKYHITANDFTYGIDSGELSAATAKILSRVVATKGNEGIGRGDIIVDSAGLEAINLLIENKVKENTTLAFYVTGENGIGTAVSINVIVTLADHGSNVEDAWDAYLTANDFTHAVEDGILELGDIIELSDAIAYDEEGRVHNSNIIKIENDPVEESIITLDELNALINAGTTGKFNMMLYTDFDINAEVIITVTLTATYTLTFETNGGSDIESIKEVNDTKINLTGKVPTKEGFTFAGWHSDEELTDPVEEITMTSDKMVYAKWTVTLYTLSYDTNGGTAISSETYNVNESVTLNKAPTKEGFTFAGWHSDEELIDLVEEITMTSDKMVYAKWTVTRYTLSYDTNGGTAIPSETYNANERVTLNKVPTRAGYTFGGWYIIVDGKEVPVTNVVMTSNITVYAKWVSIGAGDPQHT